MTDAWRCAYCATMNSNIEVACPECGLPRPKVYKRLMQIIIENWKAVTSLAIFCCIVIVAITSCVSSGIFTAAGQSLDTDESKSTVLAMVKNWTPAQNKGMSCEQAYAALVDVYQNSLGIADAQVVWSVDDPVGKTYLVHAALKGQTGWAQYQWKVNTKTNSISSLDKLSICPYSP